MSIIRTHAQNPEYSSGWERTYGKGKKNPAQDAKDELDDKMSEPSLAEKVIKGKRTPAP
jgi:hypothetical protein